MVDVKMARDIYLSLPSPIFLSICCPAFLSFPVSLSPLISFPLPNGLTQPLLLSLYLSLSFPISPSPNASPVNPISFCLCPSQTPNYILLDTLSLPVHSISPPLSHPHPLSNCPLSSSLLLNIANILQ